jgi:SAM-dependent methyltransferase
MTGGGGTPSDRQLDAFASWERRSWETRAVDYAHGITTLTRGAADALLDAAEVSAGSVLLDVATGPGVVGLAARHRGAEVTAVDQSEAMVSLARAAGLDARQATVEALPFETGAFDVAVAGFLVNHLPRPVAGVAELGRVSKARVAVSVWDSPRANPALGLFGRVSQSFDLADPAPPGPDASLYSDDARLTALLAAAGLADIRVTRVRWTLTVEPGAWFDAVAAGTPRTGAVLAAASAEQRAALRTLYVKAATAAYDSGDGRVTLPAAAVVGSGRS